MLTLSQSGGCKLHPPYMYLPSLFKFDNRMEVKKLRWKEKLYRNILKMYSRNLDMRDSLRTAGDSVSVSQINSFDIERFPLKFGDEISMYLNLKGAIKVISNLRYFLLTYLWRIINLMSVWFRIPICEPCSRYLKVSDIPKARFFNIQSR